MFFELIEIQNDILKFIDIAFDFLIIEVLVAVGTFAANELNRDLNQYQCQIRVTTVVKKKKFESKMILFLRD